MAYSFNGSNQLLRLLNANALATVYPFTTFAWGKSADLTVSQILMIFIRDSGTYNGIGNFLAGALAADPINAHGVSSASVSYADGAWHSCAGRSASSTAHDVVADGVTTSNSSSTTFEGYHEVQVGGRLIPTFSLGLNGQCCKVALWNVALDDAEIASLHRGFSPLRIRPQSLRMYGPLVRELQAVANKSASPVSFSNTNSATVSDHPRSYGF